MPPIKELRFLNEGNRIPHHSLKNLMFSSHWHNEALRRQLLSSVIRIIPRSGTPANRRGSEQFLWTLKYTFRSHSFNWYSDIFPKDPNMRCGDISPLYYGIPESRIAELSEHNGNVKILVFVRNPIERVWSKAKMNLCAHRGRRLEDVPNSEFSEFCDGVYRTWTPYAEAIELWKGYFPEAFVGFFDLLKEDPERFFQDVCDFIGLDADIEIPLMRERVNVGIHDELPVGLREYLRGQYHDEIKMLAECGRYEYPKLWLEEEYSEVI